MTFILRAIFWTAAVVMFVPGSTNGFGQTTELQTLETLKTDAILTLARVRTELNGRDFQAR